MGGGLHQAVGERGIGVQVSGDGNTTVVYAGAAELVLTRKHARKAKPTTELQLLRADLRATRLVGREGDLAALQAWLASDRPISVRCVIGRGGVGKTRLAVELCERAERDGWNAGFALYSQFPKFVEASAGWRWTKPTLVVIDYAAALAGPLRTWLEILARLETQAGGKKLRVLLLERHAERDLGWWAGLIRPVSLSDPGPDELADPLEPVPLPSLSDVEDRRALLAEAMRLAGRIAGKQPIPEPPPLGTNAEFDRRLKDDDIKNEPLYLMMAGAEAIQTGAAAALALSRVDLAERAASRERARLSYLAAQWGLPEKLVAHMALCVTLQGGCGAEDAVTLVAEERRARGFSEAVPAEDIVNHLAEALPIPGGAAIDAILPDLVGETFLLQGMREHHRFRKVQIGIMERAGRRAGGKVAATLIHTAQDFARGDAKHCSFSWLDHVIGGLQSWRDAWAVLAELPEQPPGFQKMAARAQERLLERATRTQEQLAVMAMKEAVAIRTKRGAARMSTELAAAAVTLLAPYLVEVGKEAAKTVGKETTEGGFKLLGWMREKLTGRGKEALQELEEKPDSQLNQDDLRTQLAKLLEKQPELVPQLRALVEEGRTPGEGMSQTVGAGGKAIQTKGNQNTSSIA